MPLQPRARITVLFNPDAGDQEPSPKAVERALKRLGYQARIVEKRRPDFRRILRDGGDFVVAAGGDGTVGMLARRLAGRRMPLAILPIGTANNIAKALGVPHAVRGAAGRWKRARRRRIDLGILKGPGRGGREELFIESVGVGLMPRAFEAFRRGAGPAKETAPVHDALQVFLQELRELAPERVRLRIDGEITEGDYLLIEVLNMPAVGPNLQLAKAVDPSDRLFDVVTAEEADRDSLKAYLEGRRRGHSRALELPVRRGRKVEIEAVGSGSLLHVDGDVRKLKPGAKGRVAVRLHSRGVTVLVP